MWEAPGTQLLLRRGGRGAWVAPEHSRRAALLGCRLLECRVELRELLPGAFEAALAAAPLELRHPA